MAIQTLKNSVTISKNSIRELGGMVILPLLEYKKLCARAAPTYQLVGKEAKKLDKLVEEGLEEYRAGKCKRINSLTDLD
jgi:hypothetical protein